MVLREKDLDFAIFDDELAAYAAGRALHRLIIFEYAEDTVVTDRAHSGLSKELIVTCFNRRGHFNTDFTCLVQCSLVVCRLGHGLTDSLFVPRGQGQDRRPAAR